MEEKIKKIIKPCDNLLSNDKSYKNGRECKKVWHEAELKNRVEISCGESIQRKKVKRKLKRTFFVFFRSNIIDEKLSDP